MGEGFDRFLRQYNAKGREKGDGYDASHFRGLTPEEITMAEEMLINDAKKSDTTAILGLGELKTEKCEKTLRYLLTQAKPPSYTHLRIVEALWNITHDIGMQETILEDFDDNNDALRRQAAIVLEYTIPSQLTFKTFVEMIKTDKDPINKTIAAKGILIYFKLMKSAIDHGNFDKYLPLIRLLCDSIDEKSLSAAIAEVEKEAAKLKG
jgi:hypothetical protein